MSKLVINVLVRVHVIKHSRALLSDLAVINLVNYYGERPFYKLPYPVRIALKTRRIRSPARLPTREEQQETEADALDHRRYTFTETIDDLINIYGRKIPQHV